MPYPSEHAARVLEPGQCDSFKRMNQGSGVSLILCIKNGKSSAQSYRFKKDKFTPEQAKAWLNKHNINYISFEKASEGKDMNAKLSMKAANGQPEIDGRIWSAGMHHVFVNDEPSKVYVPEETIMDTFKSIRGLIDTEGRMPIGIDHLSDSVLSDNEILAKMNLLDVGSVSKVGTDGQSIYILDSELTNQQIKDLNMMGELPSYSIVGGMNAKPCPTGQADYVVESIDVERVDIVQEGGCQVCKVGAQPNELILTSKKSEDRIMAAKWDGSASRFTIEQWKKSCLIKVCDRDVKACYKLPVREPDGTLNEQAVKTAYAVLNGSMGGVNAPAAVKAAAKKKLEGFYKDLGIKHTEAKNGDNMVNENEAPVEEVAELNDEALVEPVVEEEEEVVEEVVEDGVQDEEIEVEVKEEEEVVAPEMDDLLKQIAELKDEIKNLGGKKPKVEAKDAEKAVTELIKAGKALPKMKAGLIKTYNADPEAFAELAASMPKMVQMKAQAKLAKKAKDEEVKKAKEAEDEQMKKQLEDIFRVKL